MSELIVSPFIVRCSGLPVERLEALRFRTAAANDDTLFQQELDEKRRLLWAELVRPDFLDAVCAMNPKLVSRFLGNADSLGPGTRRNSYIRGLERTFHNMLVRFCSRNDTTGTAGMSFGGRFDEKLLTNLHIRLGPKHVGRRILYTEPGYIQNLQSLLERHWLEQLEENPGAAGSCVVELAPRYRIIQGRILDTRTSTYILENEPPLRDLALRCQKEATVNEIISGGGEQAKSALRRLILRGYLVFRALVKQNSVTGLADLAHKLRSFPPGDAFCSGVAERLQEAERLRVMACEESPVNKARLLLEAHTLLKKNFPECSVGEAVALLTVKILQKPELWPQLCVVRSTIFSVSEGRLLNLVTGAVHELPETVLRLISACGNRHSSLESVYAGLGMEKDEFCTTICTLFKHGILCLPGCDPREAKWGYAGPFPKRCAQALIKQLTASPAKPAALQLLERYLQGDISALYKAIEPSAEPSHEPPQMTERSLIIEDASMDVKDCRVGGPLLREIKRSTESMMKLLAYREYLDWDDRLEQLHSILPPGHSLPLLDLLRRLKERSKTRSKERQHLDSIAREEGNNTPPTGSGWLRALDIRWDYYDHKKLLNISEIRYPKPFLEWLDQRVVISNPDFLVMANELESEKPEFQLLFGETHSGRYRGFVSTRFGYLRDEDSISDAVVELFKNWNGLLLPQNQNDVSKVDIGCLGALKSLYFIREGGEMPNTGWERMVPAGALQAHCTDQGVEITDDRNSYTLLTDELPQKIIGVGNSDIRWELGSLLADALLGTRSDNEKALHAPEVRLESMILSRKGIWADVSKYFAPDLKEKALFAAASRLREDNGLPRLVFVRFSTGKPFFVDFENLFCLENLCGAIKRKGENLVYFSDMRPSPDELWLKDREGRYTSEIRFTAALAGSRACPPSHREKR